MADTSGNQADLEAEIRELLAELGVESRDLEAHPGQDERAERDLAEILSQAAISSPERPQPRLRKTSRIVTLIAAAAAIAVALVVVRPWTGDAPATAVTPAVLQLSKATQTLAGGSASAAPGEFRKLAAAAARQPAAGSGPVQRIVLSSWVLSTDEETGKAPAKSILTPVISERYFLPDGKFRTLEHRGDPLDADGRSGESAASFEDRTSDSDETFDGPAEGPDYADVLPTDPAALQRELVPAPEECADALAACLVSRVTFLHYNYVVTPTVSAAIWLMLAEQSEFSYAGETTDRLDRPAVAFTSDASDDSRKLILLADPETGALLGSEEVLVRDSPELGLTAPAVVEFAALVESARVPEDTVPDPSLTTTY